MRPVLVPPMPEAVRLGRAVTFDDLVVVHKKVRGTCEHCLNSGRIRKHVQAGGGMPARISVQYCYLALQDLQAEGMQRIVEHPATKEAHWIAGRSPEEWAFTLMYYADDFRICWQRAYSFVTRSLWMRSAA
jgi:hypothetical protein